MKDWLNIVLNRRRGGNWLMYMEFIKSNLKDGKTVSVPVHDENYANHFRGQLKAYGIDCEITESWDPTKEGLSSHGHMGYIIDELTGETHKTKWADEKPTLRSLTLKPVIKKPQ